MANERCQDVRFQFLHLLRGEKDPVEMTDLFRHLAECADCAAEFRAETELGRRLRTETARYVPPPDLRGAVERLVRGHWGSRWALAGEEFLAFFRRPLVAAAAGVLVALVLVIPVFQIVSRGPAPGALETLVAEAANTHRRMALQRELLGREQADVDRVMADLQERLGLPTLTTFRGDWEVRLLAVRPTFIAGQAGVTFTYLHGSDRIVTLTFLPGREIRMPKERAVQIETYRPVVTRKDSVGVVAWKQADVAYALTASASEEDLSRLFLKIRKANL